MSLKAVCILENGDSVKGKVEFEQTVSKFVNLAKVRGANFNELNEWGMHGLIAAWRNEFSMIIPQEPLLRVGCAACTRSCCRSSVTCRLLTTVLYHIQY